MRQMEERIHDAEELAKFQKNIQIYVKDKVMPDFKDYDFYHGWEGAFNGMYVS